MKKLWWAFCALLMAVSVQAWAASEPTSYGKNLVRAQDLSADALARFTRVIQAKAIGAKPNPDDQDWVGDPVPVPSSGNPYTLVVRVSGTATSDGELSAAWSGGWVSDGTSQLVPLIGAPSNAKAGEPVTLIAVSMPVSFKEDRKMPPTLHLVAAKNLRLDAVRFEIWSGAVEPNLFESFWNWTPLMAGLVVLGVSFWMRRR
jgi:hypothetical protein